MRTWTYALAITLALMASLITYAADSTVYPTQLGDFVQAWGGTIPFPFDQFQQNLLDLDSRSSIFETLIPHGRSLERFASDYHNPRAVMAWQSGSSSTPYLLLVGYTPAKEQLEVISWNWQQRHFDFSIVQDYANGKTPKIVPADRALCTVCHQNETVVFSLPSWDETTESDDTYNKLKNTADLPDFARKMLKYRNSNGRTQLRLEELDPRVRSADDLLLSQKLCLKSCGTNLECRRQILLMGIMGGTGDYLGKVYSQDRMNAFISTLNPDWNSDDFRQSDSQIIPRVVDDAHPYAIDFTEDPLVPRILDGTYLPQYFGRLDMLVNYQRCFSFTDEQMRLLKSYGLKKLEQLVESPQVSELITQWIPNGNSIMDALNAAQANQNYKAPAAPVIVAPTVLAITSHPTLSPAKLFTHYCQECHAIQKGLPSLAPELHLEDLSWMKAYVGTAGRTVETLLSADNKTMPPRLAQQPSDVDRKRMLDAILAAH